jgi:hypothetical protein
MATIQAIYGLAGRQPQGFLQSVFELMKLDLTAADHSTRLCHEFGEAPCKSFEYRGLRMRSSLTSDSQYEA